MRDDIGNSCNNTFQVCFLFLFVFIMFRAVYVSVVADVDSGKKGYVWLCFLIFVLTAFVNPHLNTDDILFFTPMFFYMFDYYKRKYATTII